MRSSCIRSSVRSSVRRARHTWAVARLLPALALASCSAPPVGGLCQDPAGCTTQQAQTFIPLGPPQIDLLFIVDNSFSMNPKQAAIADNITRFIDAIDKSGASYHVAITTSDTGQCKGIPGEDGALQVTPCSARDLIAGSAADLACKRLCPDKSFVPRSGRYISREGGLTNVPVAMENGVDQGPRRAFQCLALVGDKGCGLESQLEGARRALQRAQDPSDANYGFLRPSSTLGLIFLSDEDDCSIQPAQVSAMNSDAINSIECALGAATADLQCFYPDFRCLASSVVCDEPLTSAGVKHNCREKASSPLNPVQGYVDYFRALRPGRVVVGGVWTLPALLDRATLQVQAPPSATRIASLNRGTGVDAACHKDDEFFGQAQLRLSRFARAFTDHTEVSVCDTGGYQAALGHLADQIVRRSPCIEGVVQTDPVTGAPECIVGDVDAFGGVPDVPLRACGAGCCAAWGNAAQPTTADAGVKAACAAEAAPGCYCAVPSASCTAGTLIGAWRTAPPPTGKQLSVRCAVK